MLKKLALMLALVGVCAVALPACGEKKPADKATEKATDATKDADKAATDAAGK